MAMHDGFTWTMDPGPADGTPAKDGDEEVFDPVQPDIDQHLEVKPTGDL